MDGVAISGANAKANQVRGNLIGTNATGDAAVPNDTGVSISNQSSDNLIGGPFGGETRNLISGNKSDGIFIGPDATRNKVQGNFIGTDLNGDLPLGNGLNGVEIQGNKNLIGGTDSQGLHPGNLISSNASGVAILGGSGNQVQGNDIGTSFLGLPLGNGGAGVVISSFSSMVGANNSIGGKDAGAGNMITNNIGSGVVLTPDAGSGNAILANSIFSNAKLGIDLGNDGVTQNDSKGHTGPNHFENFPILSSATSDNTDITIKGTIDNLANTQFRLEFFANTKCDPFRNGQGQKFIFSTSVTTVGSFSVHFPDPGSTLGFITATVTTDPDNDTSEFSACVPITSTTGCQGTMTGSSSRSTSLAVPQLPIASTALLHRAIPSSCSINPSLLEEDDGSFENSIGFSGGASTAYFVNRVSPSSYPVQLQKLEIFFGNRANGLAVNTTITLLVGFNDGQKGHGTTESAVAATSTASNSANFPTSKSVFSASGMCTISVRLQSPHWAPEILSSALRSTIYPIFSRQTRTPAPRRRAVPTSRPMAPVSKSSIALAPAWRAISASAQQCSPYLG